MKLFKQLLVLICLLGLFACSDGDDPLSNTDTAGSDNGSGGGTGSDPGGNPDPGPDPTPDNSNLALDVRLFGRAGAMDEASAIVDNDLIEAERSLAR